MPSIRSHLSFANVISVIALFVALGGASYAAVSLPKNSVGSKQIKKRAVRAKHINKNSISASKLQDNSVSGAKVADGSLGSVDIVDNGLTAGDLGDDSVGAGELGNDSVRSANVVDGSLGENDLQPGLLAAPNVTVQYTKAPAPLADNSKVSVEASCPAGQTVIGGGARGDEQDSEFTVITSSRPDKAGSPDWPVDGEPFTGWRATVFNPTGGSPPSGAIEPEVWAICAEF